MSADETETPSDKVQDVTDLVVGLLQAFRKSLGNHPLPLTSIQILRQVETIVGIDQEAVPDDIVEGLFGRLLDDSEREKLFADPKVIAELERFEKRRKEDGTTLSSLSLIHHAYTLTHPPVSGQVRELIKAHGWSQKALGELAGVDESVLSRFMRGEQGITMDTLDRLSKVLRLRLVSQAADTTLYRMVVVGDRRKKGNH